MLVGYLQMQPGPLSLTATTGKLEWLRTIPTQVPKPVGHAASISLTSTTDRLRANLLFWVQQIKKFHHRVEITQLWEKNRITLSIHIKLWLTHQMWWSFTENCICFFFIFFTRFEPALEVHVINLHGSVSSNINFYEP